MDKHARFSPSGAYRWMACPGCVAHCEQYQYVSTTSPYAAEGTAAHALAAQCLELECDARDMIGSTVEEHEVTAEMAEAVQVYVDFVRAVSAGGELKVEVAVSVGITEGTADCIVYHAERGALIVADYKHGKGVVVSAVNNPQLRIYAAGALELYPDAKTIRMVVVQPRALGGGIKEDTVRREILDRWVDMQLLPAWERARTAGPEDLIAGEHCRFCPAIAMCPAQRQAALEVARAEFSPTPVFPAPRSLPAPDIAAVMSFSSQLSAWVKGVRAYAQERLEKGEKIPGWKLVAKASNRKWKGGTTDRLVELLGDDAYAKSLVSPAAAEKVLKSKGIARGVIGDLWERPEAGVTLVAEKVLKRKEITTKPGDEFIATLDIFE